MVKEEKTLRKEKNYVTSILYRFNGSCKQRCGAGEQPIVQSRYSIVLATAKRARQIIGGEEPLVRTRGKGIKPLSIAVDELYDSKIKILTDEEAVEMAKEAEESVIRAEEILARRAAKAAAKAAAEKAAKEAEEAEKEEKEAEESKEEEVLEVTEDTEEAETEE